MTISVTELGTQYAALAAWTGEPVEDVRRQVEDDHDDDRAHWIAWRDGSVIGAVHPWTQPNGTQRLYFDRTEPEAYGPLLARVDGPCSTLVDESDVASVAALRALGFETVRREVLLEIPIARTEHVVPAGYRVISAADTELSPLARLDSALRDDLPGSEGWETDEQWFREETYDSPFFDPETYLVAIDQAGAYVGLARIWNGPRPLPRLGLIGVLPAHRGRGLARALLSATFNVLAERGEPVATAEADDGNAASLSLLGSFGARPISAQLELAMSRI